MKGWRMRKDQLQKIIENMKKSQKRRMRILRNVTEHIGEGILDSRESDPLEMIDMHVVKSVIGGHIPFLELNKI